MGEMGHSNSRLKCLLYAGGRPSFSPDSKLDSNAAAAAPTRPPSLPPPLSTLGCVCRREEMELEGGKGSWAG